MNKSRRVLVLLSVTAFVSLFGQSFAGKEKFVPPVTKSGLPEILVNIDSEPHLINALKSVLIDQNYFMVKQEPLLVFESPQKKMTFGLALAEALTKSQMSQSFGNNSYLERLSFHTVQLPKNEYRLILRKFIVTNPGTPIEVVTEVTKNTKNQKDYFDLLFALKNQIEIYSPNSSVSEQNKQEIQP